MRWDREWWDKRRVAARLPSAPFELPPVAKDVAAGILGMAAGGLVLSGVCLWDTGVAIPVLAFGVGILLALLKGRR